MLFFPPVGSVAAYCSINGRARLLPIDKWTAGSVCIEEMATMVSMDTFYVAFINMMLIHMEIIDVGNKDVSNDPHTSICRSPRIVTGLNR
jgi:hypothetical protein